MVKLKTVIVCDERLSGGGRTEADPFRRVCQIWTEDGRLILDCDTFSGEINRGEAFMELWS